MSVLRESFNERRRMTRRGFLIVTGLVGAAAVVACSGGSTAAPPASSGSSSSASTIKLTEDNKFSPATLTVTKGATVTFDNGSTMVHSATDDPAKAVNKADAQLPSGAQPWDSLLIQPGQKWTHTFDVAGTYKYFCVPHESLGMVGTITVQ